MQYTYQNKMSIPNNLVFSFLSVLIILSCSGKQKNASPATVTPEVTAAVSPLFINSIVSTNIDFIEATDPDTFNAITFIGQKDKEMPDSTTDTLFDTDTYVFEMTFTQGSSVEVWAHSSFGTEAAAREYVDKLAGPLGKLPVFMRNTLSHAVVHTGEAGAFAESEGNFFVLYAAIMDVRISNNDLEETVFHESVHASLDATYLESNTWLQAQEGDQAFITQYASDNATKEDMAESALFAYTMINHPGRLSLDIETWIETHQSNRFAFFETLFN